MTALIRIGARGSKLSLAQTEQTRARLATHLNVGPETIEIVTIVTSGDVIQDRKLLDAGGKGLFTKELDEALLDGRIDLAIHSLKDVPTQLPPAIALACVPEREDPRDAFISHAAPDLESLPFGARLGTASLRRQAQALHLRPDLRAVTLRGNVDTRLRKLQAGDADATFLALAGLKRMGLEARATAIVDAEAMPPAPCQGALAVTVREGDRRTRDILSSFENENARLEIEAERAFLRVLDGSCRTPIAALARVVSGELRFIGEALTPDGKQRWRRQTASPIADIAGAIDIGERQAAEIISEAGDALYRDIAE
jgi:hydroxymethylbilane synthase